MTVGNTETLVYSMRLTVRIYFYIFVGKCCFKSGKQMTTVFHISINPSQQFLRCCIQRRYHQKIIVFQIFRFRPQEITFYIQPVQLVIHITNHIIIFHLTAEPSCTVDREPVQRRQGFIAYQHCHLISLFQIHQMAADPGKFISDHFCCTIGIIFLEVMTQQSFPVGLKRIVDGMPVPVFHHIGSGCYMTVRLKTKLSVIRYPTGESLRLCL